MLPRGDDASSLAIAQSLALASGFVDAGRIRPGQAPQWPRLRDLVLTILGCAGMAALAGPTRSWAPGLALMLAQIALAGGFYALVVAVFDIAGLRGAFVEKITPILVRLSRKGGLFKLLLPLRLG